MPIAESTPIAPSTPDRGDSDSRAGETRTPTGLGPRPGTRAPGVILRDLLIFHVKLALDGMKDVVLAPASLFAAILDVLLPGASPGHRFYAVLRVGERFDRWLSLFSAASKADAAGDGLFGASRAGSDSLLGRLEALILGHEEPESSGSPLG